MDNYKFISIAKRLLDTPTKYHLGGWGEQEDGYYLFDCVCLIKSILWGFDFKIGGHGGAIYLANGVPDVGANRLIDLCYDISYDFSKIEIGEILWLDGHVGIYVGDRHVVEATKAWESKVLESTVLENGVRIKNNHQVYTWIKHGKLPYITYNAAYSKITKFEVYDITLDSIKISYDVSLPVDEVLYSFDRINYYPLKDDIIVGLIPDHEYEISIKVKRIYTSNYTESTIIKFKTLKNLKYKVGDIVYAKGNVYLSENSNIIIDKVESICKITNTIDALHPYEINNYGFVDENIVKPYKEFDLFNFLFNLLLLLPVLISFLLIIKSIF